LKNFKGLLQLQLPQPTRVIPYTLLLRFFNRG